MFSLRVPSWDRPEARGLRFACPLFAALIVVAFQAARAQEDFQGELPPPESADGLESPLGAQYQPPRAIPLREPILFSDLKKSLEPYDPFWSQAQVKVHLRPYYFRREFGDGPLGQAFAIGNEASYESGWWRDFLRIGASVYTSQRIYGPPDESGTGLLQPGNRSYTVPGKSYAELRYRNLHLMLFRNLLDLPYLNPNDSRMIPNLFQYYSLFGHDVAGFDFCAGYVDRFKGRLDSFYKPMYEAAGIQGSDQGLWMAGVRYAPENNGLFTCGLFEIFGADYINILYGEATCRHELENGLGFFVSAQSTLQNSVGDELRGSFGTWMAGGKAALSYEGVILTVAYTTVSEDRGMQSPWSGYPGYTSAMIFDFNRAGEDAFLVGFACNFDKIGIRGLGLTTNYIVSRGPSAAGAEAEEWDATLDYRVHQGTWDGLWIRVRYGTVSDSLADEVDRTDVRILANYTLRLL